MPRLAGAEQVAGAADLEVAHGDLEARAQLGRLADGLEALVGLFGERAVAGVEQVGVGALARPPDPAPDLVELTEAQQVGPVDDQGVHGGHVDARLDDRRADEHVVLALPEVEHHLLERALVHLPVGDGDAGLGHEVAQTGGHVVDVLHPVVHVEHLALAQQLAADGLGHRPVVLLAHVGEDRLALGRRGVQQREVADAGQAHLERAGDGRGAERQHVDAGAELLDLLLVGDAEALLLVDHEQAEVLELHVSRQQPVGADHHVDLARLDALRHLPRLPGSEEARQHLDPHRVGRRSAR